jgi:hypothetical protein
VAAGLLGGAAHDLLGHALPEQVAQLVRPLTDAGLPGLRLHPVQAGAGALAPTGAVQLPRSTAAGDTGNQTGEGVKAGSARRWPLTSGGGGADYLLAQGWLIQGLP